MTEHLIAKLLISRKSNTSKMAKTKGEDQSINDLDSGLMC